MLVDFVCHGVPSQDLFNKSIESYEKKTGRRVRSFQFRHKGKGVKHPQSYRIVYEDKRGLIHEEMGLHYQFPYYFAFQTHISLRRSCYSCPWATSWRCSDITMGDFWSIDKAGIGLNANDGVSMLVANTAKGEAWLQDLESDGSLVLKKTPYSFAIKHNDCLASPTKMPARRNGFFTALLEDPFELVEKKYMKSRHQFLFDIYYAIPTPIRRIVRRIMNKKMRYEY